MLKFVIQSMLFLTGYSQESNGDINPPMVGGQIDPNNCLIGAGYTWCESSQSCIRQWETPCQDNYNDCSDCLKRQRNGENIACPIDCDTTTRSDCLLDSDCLNTHFCRSYTMNTNGPKECVPFSNVGESCGGYTLPSQQSRCDPTLECANVRWHGGPMIADAPGQCMRPCKTNNIRDSYGNCNLIRGGVMEPDIMPPMIPMPPMPPMLDQSADPPVAAGARCASGFCENPSDCPQCATGSTCSVQPGLMCAGTCYGTCSMPPPAAPVCSDVMCMMYCENGFQKDTNGCDMCLCEEIHNSECPIPYTCTDRLCPKITEITTCGEGGISGYTTYQLSLIINDNTIHNIYALFGDLQNDQSPMIIPAAYQVGSIYGNNLGGVSDSIVAVNPNSRYDSWLTLGITNGDLQNKIGTIGIDYNLWDENTPLRITNGAIFLMDPNEITYTLNEVIIGQLTISNTKDEVVVINVQGKLKDGSTWKQYGITYSLSSPINQENHHIPLECSVWYDGCNTCQVNNGIIGSCTRLMCFTENPTHCINYNSGH